MSLEKRKEIYDSTAQDYTKITKIQSHRTTLTLKNEQRNHTQSECQFSSEPYLYTKNRYIFPFYFFLAMKMFEGV
jgi:hypothetical protein